MRFFTADQHFGHRSIIQYCERPFSSVTEMDERMIDLWNFAVGPEDEVYHLSDFCLGDLQQAEKYFPRLAGRIYVLNSQHHDRRWINEYLIRGQPIMGRDAPIHLLPPIWTVSSFVCCHFPLFEWHASYHGAPHLHGHCHGRLKPGARKMVDVGVDVWGFKPVSEDDINSYLSIIEGAHP